MTQVIACLTPQGIVLASDGRATWFGATGETGHFPLKKIIPLNSHVALVSAGAGWGVKLGMAFQEFVQMKRIDGVEAIWQYARPFFAEQLMRVDEKRRADSGWPQLEDLPLPGIYVVLAGYSFKDRQRPYHLHFLGRDEDGAPLTVYPVVDILVMPRSLSMERRLEAQCKGGANLDQILSLCQSFLLKRSLVAEEVGPPFWLATITSAGFREITIGEQER